VIGESRLSKLERRVRDLEEKLESLPLLNGLTVAEGAVRLGCSVRTVERMIASGALPTRPMYRRFTEEDLLRAQQAYASVPNKRTISAKGRDEMGERKRRSK